MAVIDGITLKNRHMVIPESVQTPALEKFHFNSIGIDKTKSWHINQFIGH